VTDRACVYAIYIAHTERGPPECSCFDVFITLRENREYLLGSPRFTPYGHDINTACTRPECARGEKNLTKSLGPIYPYSLYRGSHRVAHLTRVTSCVRYIITVMMVITAIACDTVLSMHQLATRWAHRMWETKRVYITIFNYLYNTRNAHCLYKARGARCCLVNTDCREYYCCSIAAQSTFVFFEIKRHEQFWKRIWKQLLSSYSRPETVIIVYDINIFVCVVFK